MFNICNKIAWNVVCQAIGQCFHLIKSLIFNEKAVSLILALSIISFMISFVVDLMITSSVANKITINLQDGLRADYLAKSGENLAIFLLSIDYGIDLKTQELTKQPIVDGNGDISLMFNELPIGSSDNEMLSTLIKTFGLSQISDSAVLDKLKEFNGSFIIRSTDESAKINLSYLNSSRMAEKIAFPMLKSFLSCETEQEFLEDKNINSVELAHRIFDFIDEDTRNRSQSGLSSEDAPYLKKDPSYKSFNHPLESVNQLRAIVDWDREVHAVFSPFITVHPVPWAYGSKSKNEISKDPVLNINTVSREVLQCLFPEMDDNCYQRFVREFTKIKENKGNLASSVSAIPSVLSNQLCYLKSEKVNRAKWF